MRKQLIIKYTLMLCLLSIALSPAAQNARSRHADSLFDNYLYTDAIRSYEAIHKKDAHVWRRLAESYKLTGDNKQSEKYYTLLISSGKATAADRLQYTQVLKMNGKYEEAIQQMSTYDQQVSGDKRVVSHTIKPDYYKELLTDNGQFAISSLKNNSVESDFSATYYKDRIVFVSTRHRAAAVEYNYNWNKKNFLNLYTAQPKKGSKNRWKKIRYLKAKGKLNKRFHEGPATFNASGDLMILTRNRYTSRKELNSGKERVLELWYSTKNKKGKWGAPQPMVFNNKEYSVGHPALTPDGKTLYFVSDMPGGRGETDIYISTMQNDGTWSAPVNAGENVNTEGKEMFPFYHHKGMLFFASDGHAGLGGLDVFIAGVSNGKTGKPKNVGAPVNTSADDFAFVLDSAMTRGYFSSNREGGKGSDDIYTYDLLKPFKLTKKLEGYTRERNTLQPLSGVAVKLYDKSGNVIAETNADANGYYSFETEPDAEYRLEGTQPDYTGDSKQVAMTGDEQTVQQDLLLEKIPNISLSIFVSDLKSGAPISGAKITLREKATGKETVILTDASGSWKQGLEGKKINDQLSYSITVEKEGYLSKMADFNHTIVREGEIKVHENLDLRLGRLEIGGDIGKLIDIRPIYFDLGKYAIRKDAAVELDKIVSIMQQYPGLVIELGSHTDCRGSIASNERLSDKRAKSSAAYIIGKGISKDRIYGKGYGESKLVNGCGCEGTQKSTCSEEEHQQNRRTEFIIVKM